MTRNERLRYEMFVRVRDFGSAHRPQFPEASTAGKAFTVVAAAVGEIEAHATEKHRTAQEGKKAKAAARAAILERLTAVARTARVIARSAPGAADVFQLPAQKSDIALLTAARAFIREGQTAPDRFEPFGMPATFVTELQALVGTFEQAIRGRQAGRTGLAAAQAGIATAIAQGTEALRTLDVVVANTLAEDPVLLAVWKRDRRVQQRGRATATVSEEPVRRAS